MKELRDQSAHLIAAVVILLPLALWPSIVTFTVAGFLCGMVREITEEGTPVTLAKVRSALHSYLDLTFWALGGMVAGMCN